MPYKWGVMDTSGVPGNLGATDISDLFPDSADPYEEWLRRLMGMISTPGPQPSGSVGGRGGSLTSSGAVQASGGGPIDYATLAAQHAANPMTPDDSAVRSAERMRMLDRIQSALESIISVRAPRMDAVTFTDPEEQAQNIQRQQQAMAGWLQLAGQADKYRQQVADQPFERQKQQAELENAKAQAGALLDWRRGQASELAAKAQLEGAQAKNVGRDQQTKVIGDMYGKALTAFANMDPNSPQAAATWKQIVEMYNFLRGQGIDVPAPDGSGMALPGPRNLGGHGGPKTFAELQALRGQ